MVYTSIVDSLDSHSLPTRPYTLHYTYLPPVSTSHSKGSSPVREREREKETEIRLRLRSINVLLLLLTTLMATAVGVHHDIRRTSDNVTWTCTYYIGRSIILPIYMHLQYSRDLLASSNTVLVSCTRPSNLTV